MSSQLKFNWSQFKFLNFILNCIKKKNRGTSSIQLNFLIHQLTVCLFRFNRNTVTGCFGIEAKQPKQMFCFGYAETSFGSSFGCFESKLISKDNLDAVLGAGVELFDKNSIRLKGLSHEMDLAFYDMHAYCLVLGL